MDESVAFSLGEPTPFGKYVVPVKTLVDEETFEAWIQLCARRKLPSAVLLRELVFLVVHGRTPAEIAAQDTRQLLSEAGLNQVRGNGGAQMR